MSTYTDLRNRVKENITVDYHTRATTQKISALNEENLFVGTFRGRFQQGEFSNMSCWNCTMLSGKAVDQLLVRPMLSVGFDSHSQEPIVSSLTAYIAAHGCNISVDEGISSDSVNPVQNKAIYHAFEYVRNYVTNILGTQVTDLINQKFDSLQALSSSFPAEDQEEGKSAKVYTEAGEAKFYTVKTVSSVKEWVEAPTSASMYVSKMTDVDGLSAEETLERLLSCYGDNNDHVPASKLVKKTAEKLSALAGSALEGDARRWISAHFDYGADETISLCAFKACDGFQVSGDSTFQGSIDANSYLSVDFGKVMNTASLTPLSDLLDPLDLSVKVRTLCDRSNEIKQMAKLTDVPYVRYTTDNVSGLISAVEKISYPNRQDLSSLRMAAESLNDSLNELCAASGGSLDDRFRSMSERINGLAESVDETRFHISAALSCLPEEQPVELPLSVMTQAFYNLKRLFEN